MNSVICTYCGNEAEWISNEAIYGYRAGESWMIWLCRDCDAWVGCHRNTTRPLGTIANKELRGLRVAAHNHIDRLWRSGRYKRTTVYLALELVFGRVIHIGQADEETCRRILQLKL